MIERRGERGSGISVLAARHDNDDDDADFEKRVIISCASWWLCSTKAVSSSNMTSRTGKFVIFLVDLN